MEKDAAATKCLNKAKAFDNDYKLGPRQDSQQSQSSSLSKFLRRKPDHKKILQGVQSKKKRENSSSEYFNFNEKTDDKLTIHDVRFQASRFIPNMHQSNDDSKIKQREPQLLLESTKSEENIFLRRNQIGLLVNKNFQKRNKIKWESLILRETASQIKNKEESDNLITKVEDFNVFAPHQRISSKKSKTQFFNYEQLRGLSEQNSGLLNKNDSNELSSTRQYGDLSQENQELRQQSQLLSRKLKLVEKQMELSNQRNYLLTTEKKHLQQMIKQKDKIIDRLQRERSVLKTKEISEADIQRYKQSLKEAQGKITKYQESQNALKIELNVLQTQINMKNEELILVYDQYTELQSKYRKQHQQQSKQIEKMKAQVDKIGQSQRQKQESLDCSQLNETAKLKQKIFRQQQEIKYLHIQNQCLLISKDQLCKTQNQNRKLREERDYFKKRIMQNINRTKRPAKDFSRSDNASLILELSDPSIDHR